MDYFVKRATLLRRQLVVGCAVARVVRMGVLERKVLADVYEVICVKSLFIIGVVSACATDRRHLMLLFFPCFELS